MPVYLLKEFEKQKTLVSMCVGSNMAFLYVTYHTCHWCSWWNYRMWKVLYADVTWLIMLTLVRSNTLRIGGDRWKFLCYIFSQRSISEKTPVPYYDNIWPTCVVTNCDNFLSYSGFQDPKGPDWIQLFSSRGGQCLHPVYKSSATHLQKLPVIEENFFEITICKQKVPRCQNIAGLTAAV